MNGTLGRRALVSLSLIAVLAGTACYKTDPLYCDDASDCADVAGRPFCDVAGEYAGSDGIAHTCIATPTSPAPTRLGIDAVPRSQYLEAGGQLVISVSLTSDVAFTDDVEISVDSTALAVAVPPQRITPGTTTATLVVTAPAATPLGAAELTITAMGQGLTAQDSVALRVVGQPATPDLSFDVDGSVVLDVLPRPTHPNDRIQQVLVQDDSLIVMVVMAARPPPSSSPPATFLWVRVLADGTLDRNFGAAGVLTIGADHLTNSSLLQLVSALDREGRLHIVGTTRHQTGGESLFSMRYTRDGRRPGAALGAYVFEGVVQPLVEHVRVDDEGVTHILGRTGGRLVWWRLDALGNPDAGFGSGGQLLLAPSTEGTVDGCCAAVLADGDVLLFRDFTSLVRVRVGADLDPTFGDAGALRLPFGSTSAGPGRTAEVSGGALVATGGANGRVGLWRFSADGAADESFGTGGHMTFPVTKEEGAIGIHAIVERDSLDLSVLGLSSVMTETRDFLQVPRFGRVTAGGALDTTFASSGLRIDRAGSFPMFHEPQVAVLPDRRVAFVGWSIATDRLVVRRYWY